MDLKDLDVQTGAEAGAVVELKHPVTGAALGATLRVRGSDAPSYRAALLEMRRRRLDQMAKTGLDRVDPAHLDDETLDLMVAATLGWEGLQLEGQEFVFTTGNARTLYARYPWVREQAAAVIAERANFLPRSASGS